MGFFGASFTLPEVPLGNANIPVSAPCVMARLRCEVFAAFMSRLYVSSMYYKPNIVSQDLVAITLTSQLTFLRVALETPVRDSLLFATMHS